MNLFNRIRTVALASAHQAVDTTEDPEVMLKQVVRDMDQGIREARAAVVGAVSAEKQLAAQVERHRRRAAEFEHKAESALAAGRDDLARAALTRKAEHDRIREETEVFWREAKEASTRLQAQLDTLVQRRGEACRRREVLAARQRAAQASRRLCASIAATGPGAGESAAERFARMQDRVTEMEAEAQAVAEVLSESCTVTREISDLEITARADAELERMKDRLTQRPTPPQGA